MHLCSSNTGEIGDLGVWETQQCCEFLGGGVVAAAVAGGSGGGVISKGLQSVTEQCYQYCDIHLTLSARIRRTGKF